MSHLPFLLASLVWNLGLGMTWLVVPLYAASQGLSNAQIGSLFALPVLAQVTLNLVGGAYTDRVGGLRIMLGSCWIVVVSGLWFMLAEGFWMLMAGQIGLVLGRAAFWPATWAMASELPGNATQRVRALFRGNNLKALLYTGTFYTFWNLAAGTAGTVLRRSRIFLQVQRYVSGSIFVGLGALAATTGRNH